MTWSCWIDSDKANPHGLETHEFGGKFRVKLRSDGVSDWITHRGNQSPVAADVLVSVRNSTGFGSFVGTPALCVEWGAVNQFRVHGTPEAETPKGRYMVSVDGLLAPSKEHETLEAAIADAQILGARPANATNTVRVLQVVATLPPVGERQVVMAGEAA